MDGAQRRGCDYPACRRTVCVIVRDSTAEEGFAYLCGRHWPAWMPPAADAGPVKPYTRKRRKRKVSG